MTVQGSDTANTHQPTGGPPPYSLQTTQASSDGTSTSTVVKSALRPNVPASNYQFIRQDSASITGTFVIDPSLEVPDDLILGAVPPDDNSENHFNKDKNLSLEAKDASITADIWLVKATRLKKITKVHVEL